MANANFNLNGSKLFSALRNNQTQNSSIKPSVLAQFYFQIICRDSAVFLKTVDLTGKIVELDYQAFSGAKRELLKAYSETLYSWESTDFWGESNEDDGILLYEHSQLMWILSRCDNVVDFALNPISFVEPLHSLELSVSEAEDFYEATVELLDESRAHVELSAPVMLSESHILSGNSVYSVQPLGSNFASAPLFAERFPKDQLSEFLSLFFSSFTNLPLSWSQHSVEEGEVIDALPALIFRQLMSIMRYIWSWRSVCQDFRWSLCAIIRRQKWRCSIRLSVGFLCVRFILEMCIRSGLNC